MKELIQMAEKAPKCPLNEQTRYIAVTDSHVNKRDARDEFACHTGLFFSFMEHIQNLIPKVTGVFYGGDIADLWEARFKDIYKHNVNQRVFSYIRNNVVKILRGNHDRKLDQHLIKIGFTLNDFADAVWIGPNILMMHGDRPFDVFNRGGWLTTVVRWFVKYIWVFLQKLGLDSESPHETSKRPQRIINLKSILKLAVVMLSKRYKKPIVLMVGHFHDAGIETCRGYGALIDLGCWTHKDSVTYADIDDRKIVLMRMYDNGKKEEIGVYHLPNKVDCVDFSVGP